MFPLIVTGASSSAYIPHHHDLQASPLTTDYVMRDSNLRDTDSGCDARLIGNLSWIENEQVASLNSRIDFINKMTSHILEKIPLRDTPITLISLGSGGLLTEYFIHQQLENSGYQDINWRIIDSDYQNGGYENTRKEFREKVNGNVRAFTAEQAYLNKPLAEGDKKLAGNDRNRGAAVILAINPPTILSSAESFDDSFMRRNLANPKQVISSTMALSCISNRSMRLPVWNIRKLN